MSNYYDQENIENSKIEIHIKNNGNVEIDSDGKKTVLVSPKSDLKKIEKLTKLNVKQLQQYFPETYAYFLRKIKSLPETQFEMQKNPEQFQDKNLLAKATSNKTIQQQKEVLLMVNYLMDNINKDSFLYEHDGLFLSLSFLLNLCNHKKILAEINEQREYYLTNEPISSTYINKLSDGYFCNIKVEDDFLSGDEIANILEHFLIFQIMCYNINDGYFLDNLLADINIINSLSENKRDVSSFDLFENLTLNRVEEILYANYGTILSFINASSDCKTNKNF